MDKQNKNLSNAPQYHRVYRLRDKEGNDLTDLLEVHIVELQKKLSGEERMNDWIRVFNAKTEVEWDMIKTKNPGILEAIREIKLANAGKVIRAMYDAHMKEIRDRDARDDYVREEGRTAGEAIGEARGRAEGFTAGELQKLISQVRKKAAKGMAPEEITDIFEEEPSLVSRICNVMKKHPDWDDEKIRESM